MKFVIYFIFFYQVHSQYINSVCLFVDRNFGDYHEYHCKASEKISPDKECLYLFPKSFDYPELHQNSTEMTRLKISECELKHIKKCLKSYKYLNSLDISFSELPSFESFLEHEYLKKFNASHNNLLDIPSDFFKKTSEINEIDFSYNRLETLHSRLFENLIDLEYIDLSFNFLKHEIDSMFHDCTKLKTVHLENNTFYYVPMVNADEVYLSWKYYFQFVDSTENDKKIHVVLNNEKDGFFRKSNEIIELHCNEQSFEDLNSFESNRIMNVPELLQCFTSSLTWLNISGNFVGKVNLTTFQHLSLDSLYLSNTHLEEFDLVVLENQTGLWTLDISNNNLKYLKNANVLANLQHVHELFVGNNQLNNIPEILQHLNPSLHVLDLSNNVVGSNIETIFEKFTDLIKLYLKNTSLYNFDSGQFHKLQLTTLDVSENDLGDCNFSSFSSTLSKLTKFYAADCNIGHKLEELITFFNPSIETIDLSKNPILSDNRTIRLKLTRKHYSYRFHIRPGELQLNISYNNIEKVIFPPSLTENTTNYFFECLSVLDLEGNDLMELEEIDRFPWLGSIGISKNRFSCEYLEKFKLKWPKFSFIGNEMHQKHKICTTYMKSIWLHIFLVAIGTLAVAIIVVVLCLYRRSFKRTIYQSPEGPETIAETHIELTDNENTDNQEEIEEPVYAEIAEDDHHYDHLHDDALPISFINHYHNVLLMRQAPGQ